MKALDENQKTHPATEVLPDLSRLKQYTRAKQTVASVVRNLSGFLKRSVGEREAEACRQLMAQLAEDRFALAVVGQFKRGKSSLMNAIIGRDLLPTGVLPLTSAITVLKYGPRERLTIVREGVLYPEEAPVSSLAEYVTEKGNPGNVKKVMSFLNEETRTLLDQLNDRLSQSSWKLSFVAVQDYLGKTLPQFKQHLETWARARSEQPNAELRVILQQEWAGIEQELLKIPAAAAEILGGFAAEVSADEMSSELPIHGILMRPALAHLDWSPRVPLLQASLPVFLVRSFLRKRLTVEIYSLLGACGQHVEEGLEDGVYEALGRMGSELEKRALEIESRIVQAVKGKRLSKGNDGHWQIQEFDRSSRPIPAGGIRAFRTLRLDLGPCAEAGALSGVPLHSRDRSKLPQ